MLELLQRLLGKDDNIQSKNVAKERLRLVLVQDRCNISPQILESLKVDLINVISNYMEIDETGLDVNISEEEDALALIANIPILRMRRTPKHLKAPRREPEQVHCWAADWVGWPALVRWRFQEWDPS
jgi:cell division topological specificity factor